MPSDGVSSAGERPLANAGPVLVVAGVGFIAAIGLVLSLFRDPGLPSYIQDSYMRVAGGLVTPDHPMRDTLGLSATLSQAPPGPVRVPALDRLGYELDGGTHVTLGGTPAALAIYHNAQRELVTWHGVAGTADDLPAAPEVRTAEGRNYFVHYKASTTIVVWQEGPRLMAITSTLPVEQLMVLALAAASARP